MGISSALSIFQRAVGDGIPRKNCADRLSRPQPIIFARSAILRRRITISTRRSAISYGSVLFIRRLQFILRLHLKNNILYCPSDKRNFRLHTHVFHVTVFPVERIDDFSISGVSIGQHLANARSRIGLSVGELAGLSGVSYSLIVQLEAGRENITIRTLARLCGALAISPARLIENAILVDRTFYRLASEREDNEDGVFRAYLDEKGPLPDEAEKGLRRASIDLVSGCCQVVAAAVRSVEPLLIFSHAIRPEHPNLMSRFDEFSKRINKLGDEFKPFELLKDLRAKPYWTLKKNGVIDRSVLHEFITWSEGQHPRKTWDPMMTILRNMGLDMFRSNVTIHPMISVSDSRLERLLKRLKAATTERGSKAKLARSLGVVPQRLAEWLNGTHAPSAEITLRLLEWVAVAEANQQHSRCKRGGTAQKEGSDADQQ